MTDGKDVLLSTLWKNGTAALAAAGIAEARQDAWLLLEFVTGTGRAAYFAHPEYRADQEQEASYRRLIAQRAEHVPLQHLTHQAFFMGHEFYVDRHVLVPRQDTETLAEEALKCLALLRKEEGTLRHPRILDMCTGSGCILISLLLEEPSAAGTGADLSGEALAVARRNLERHGLEGRARLVQSDLFSSEYFCKKDGNIPPVYDMLISNPPYIPTGVIDTLAPEVRLHDPRMALDGKEDGLYFYRQITARASDFLRPGGWLLYEIGYDQGKTVPAFLEEAGFADVRVIRDLGGLDRVVAGRRKYVSVDDKQE